MSGRSELDGVESTLVDPLFIAEIRAQMIRFAQAQLGDRELAEDATQEALIGALRNGKSFQGRAALRTWIFAILKNKVADILRQRIRLERAGLALAAETETSQVPQLFNARGYWPRQQRPVVWADPETALHDSQFWAVFESCLDRLPPRQSRVFMMREFIELETHEICAELDLTETNVHVILHRARLALRGCLERNWFAVESSKC